MPVYIKLANGSIINSNSKTNAHINFGYNLVLEIEFQGLECKIDCILGMIFFLGFNP